MRRYAKKLGSETMSYEDLRKKASLSLGEYALNYKEIQEAIGSALTRKQIGHLIPPPDYIEAGTKYSFYKRDSVDKIIQVTVNEIIRMSSLASKIPLQITQPQLTNGKSVVASAMSPESEDGL